MLKYSCIYNQFPCNEIQELSTRFLSPVTDNASVTVWDGVSVFYGGRGWGYGYKISITD